jgi:hypothetical protein
MERNDVLKSYSSLVSHIWEDEQVLEQLKADPKKVLSNFGFDIPADAQVNLIIRDLNTDGTPETQVDMLTKGDETGVYDIIIPLKPEGVDVDDLPLKEEVLELMGGAGCCPCSTCCCPCCDDDAQTV